MTLYPDADEAHTRAMLDARRALAQVWADVTRREVHAIDFTADYLRAQLRSRWLERRSLADGTVPAVGQRVVTVREVAKSWGLGHAHDELVHEITSLLGGDTHLVECGPQQIGVGMLRLAPPDSEVTCGACAGWRAQRERWRIDAEVFRAAQFEHAALRKQLAEARRIARRLRCDNDGEDDCADLAPLCAAIDSWPEDETEETDE